MFDITNLETPVFGDKESGLRFVTEALKVWEASLATYQGKADKATAKVAAVLEAVQENDPLAVKLTDETLEKIRSLILSAVSENPNCAVLLFPHLEDIKQAVGSYRDECSITPEAPESDEDRDIVAEFDALDAARTMIEGTFNAWQLSVTDLPAKFQGEKKERISQPDGTNKNVPTGEKYLSFPGKLTNPNGEGKTSPGKVATSYNFLWEIEDREGETITIGKSTVTRLARLVSNEYMLLSFKDLKERLDNHKWQDKDTQKVKVSTPRGTLIGIRVNK